MLGLLSGKTRQGEENIMGIKDYLMSLLVLVLFYVLLVLLFLF